MDSTIIGALIGAAATILAAFISRGFAQQRVESTEPSKPLDKLTATILHLFSIFSVKSAHVIRLRKGQVHVNDELGFVLTVEQAYLRPNQYAVVRMTSLIGSEPKRFNFHPADVIQYSNYDGDYYLICTSVAGLFYDIEIQVREVEEEY